ncbi:MAG: FAD-dependent oxidoreductase [Gammaproteobacteria bacterium]
MKIAIIGTGISGLTAAYLLHRHHDITIYEANDYIGGHTATVDVELDGANHAVDTGFIVYNDWTYPNFIKLMDRLGVQSQATEMGFSVTTRHQNYDFEYCGSTINSLFADRRQILNPAFLRMVRDIMIWSASTAQVADFDTLFFVRFFANHGLLNIADRPQWRVLKGGSRSYIKPITQGFRKNIRLNTAVQSVHRGVDRVTVSCTRGVEGFDHVIFACHSDQALNLLRDPDTSEKEILEAIPYRDNSVILHTDEGLLPTRRNAWASWNYLLDGTESQQPVLTYNMNILQGIETVKPICVTVNGEKHIDPSKVLRRFNYSHPQFGRGSVAAQGDWEKINGHKRTWFCGAYWRNGFHEDGVVSAIPVVDALGGDRL